MIERALAKRKPRPRSMDTTLLDYFRCPEQFANLGVKRDVSTATGFFQFGERITCYGQCAASAQAGGVAQDLPDRSDGVRRLDLPFDLTEIVNNLRYERYRSDLRVPWDAVTGSDAAKRIYYSLRPLLPVRVRRHLQRARLRGWEKIRFPHWPVDPTVEYLMERVLALMLGSQQIASVPFIWFWPDGAPSCAVMTHDVEGAAGRDFCGELMNLDDGFAIKASFQIIPEMDHGARTEFLDAFRARGFEINVHDLYHDGALFQDEQEFARRAKRINQYVKEFNAEGFRSGAMYRNQDWYRAFEFSYDMSVPNVAHLEPQRGGCCTVMPYFIGKILELPLTTIQDYSLFHILGDYSINLWKEQIDLIMGRNGLASFITHPDYLREKRAQDVYLDLLSHLTKLRDQKQLWCALPRDVNRWWRNRHQMRLVHSGNQWRIEGPDSERARVAYATLEGDQVVYSVDRGSNRTQETLSTQA